MNDKKTQLVRVRTGDAERLDAIGNVLTRASGEFRSRADVVANLLDDAWDPHYESVLRALRKKRQAKEGEI